MYDILNTPWSFSIREVKGNIHKQSEICPYLSRETTCAKLIL